jgi:glutamate synthase domain-containing protein 3
VDGSFGQRCNTGMVRLLEPDDENDGPVVRELLERHLAYTQSPIAEELLENWPLSLSRFIKILPVDYERALAARQTALGVAV